MKPTGDGDGIEVSTGGTVVDPPGLAIDQSELDAMEHANIERIIKVAQCGHLEIMERQKSTARCRTALTGVGTSDGMFQYFVIPHLKTFHFPP